MTKNPLSCSKRTLYISLILLMLLVNGCKVELYSNLTEQEANEMLALLLQHEIPCEKIPGQEQSWILKVESSLIPTALSLLQEYGYPKPKFENMGEIFKKQGLVSSPLEERVRFIYALSQELAQTISQIDGVLTARVHIVLPENNPFGEKAIPSAASVFIKCRDGSSLKSLIPNIKALVANSIEGLSYDRISVFLFETEKKQPFSLSKIAVNVFGIKLFPDSVVRFWTFVGVLSFLCFAGVGVSGFLFWKLKSSRGDHSSEKTEESEQKKEE